MNSSATVVLVVGFLVQKLPDFYRKKIAFRRLIAIPEPLIIPRFSNPENLALQLHWLLALRLCDTLIQATRYFFRL